MGDYSARPTIANAPPRRSWRPYGSIRSNAGPPRRDKAAIRKGLLPKLYTLMGLENAKSVIEQVIQITRVGLSRG